MKKLIAILTLFVFSLFMVYPQSKSKVMYVDTLKSVIVNVSTDVSKQKPVIDPAQLQFAKSLDTQNIVQKELSGNVDTLASVLTNYVKEVEAKNKSDGESIFNKFGYTDQDVNKIIKKERWLTFLTAALALLYLFYVNNELSKRDYADNLLFKAIIYLGIGVIGFLLIKWLLILTINPGYFIIKELIALYT